MIALNLANIIHTAPRRETEMLWPDTPTHRHTLGQT